MWDDEDNNPYGSFTRRDSELSPGGFAQQESDAEHQSEDEYTKPTTNVSVTDQSNIEQNNPRHIEPRKGGYDSRIEQILYENPDLEIQIISAGKSVEGGGYIVYTIRTGEIEVRRRYSEFASLRRTLVALHPTSIVPPIPEKHSISDYAAKPTKAKEDEGIIDLRKRMLATFLNRCRKMKDIREDGVWWRFLDPNASWNEVLHSHPVSSLPKNILRAPPLDPANPSQGHQYLPIPSSSAKLKSDHGSSSTVTSPSGIQGSQVSSAAHTIPGPQVFDKFPPVTGSLQESELDPYFLQFEATSKELEALLQGPMERTNQRALSHLFKLGEDMVDLGARFNAFSLSEASQSVGAAIEKIGQACDTTSLETRELAHNLSAQFAEPMRENAQFVGVVRHVLRYRILKRIQEEMTRDELAKKQVSLEALEKNEQEAQRIQQYLDTAGTAPANPPSSTTRRANPSSTSPSNNRNKSAEDLDTASIDSDFPTTVSSSTTPSANQGLPTSSPSTPITSPSHQTPQQHRRGLSISNSSGSSSFVTNKILNRITHAFNGVVDSDPERSRRDQIGKTKESLSQLEMALEVAHKDVSDASTGVLKDLRRFQSDKEDDVRRYMMNFAKCHIHWAKKSIESWEDAKAEVGKISIGVQQT